jgi:hypothetical protein
MADNPLIDTPEREQRIRERAYHLWQADGCPHHRDKEYWERARELIGIEESAGSGLLPNPETHPAMLSGQPEGVEEAQIQENYGEFPDRFADQGEWQQTPEARHSKRGRRQGRAKSAAAGAPKPAGSS